MRLHLGFPPDLHSIESFKPTILVNASIIGRIFLLIEIWIDDQTNCSTHINTFHGICKPGHVTLSEKGCCSTFLFYALVKNKEFSTIIN